MDDPNAIAGAGAGGGGADGAGDGGAAAAVADPEVDPNAGGGAAPADGGEAGGGDGAAAAGGAEEERLPGDQSTDDHPEREEISTDGRTIDKATRDAISRLEKTDKNLAKFVRDTAFRNQAVAKEFPEAKNFKEVVSNIRTLKATLEAVGGSEGIESLETEVGDYRNEIQQFARGDRSLIEQLYEANPENTMVAARNALEVLGEKSAKLLDEAMLPSVVRRFNQAQLPQILAAVMKFCEEGKGQEAWDQAKRVHDWMTNLATQAGEISKNVKQVDPREQALTDRENKMNQREADHYDRTISNSVTKRNNDALGTVLTASFWKSIGYDGKDMGESRRDFTQGVMNRVWAAMKADKTFQKNAHAVKAKGDADRSAEFISDKFEELLPDIFRNYKNMRFPSRGAAKPAAPAAKNGAAPANKAAAPAAAAAVTLKPKPQEIDWDKTTDEMFNIGGKVGKAYRKDNGKLVQWNWADQP